MRMRSWLTISVCTLTLLLAGVQVSAEPPPTPPSEGGEGLEGGEGVLLPVEVSPELRLVDHTMELYDIIVEHRFARKRGGERNPEKFPQGCRQLAKKLDKWLDANESDIEGAADDLAATARTLTDEEVDLLGERLRKRLAGERSKLKKGQRILYDCLHSARMQGDDENRPLTKQMKRFHRMQQHALKALIRIPKKDKKKKK